MKKIILVTTILIGGFAFSQRSYTLLATKAANGEINDELQGSMYFDKDFHLAIIDGKKEKPYMLRYNAYFDAMEFYEGKELYLVEKDTHKTFDFGAGRKFYVLKNYVPKDTKKSIKGYLIQLEKGNVTLYKSQTMVHRLADTKDLGGFGPEPKAERIEPAKEIFYMQVGEGDVVALPKSKNSLAELINRDKKEFSKFMKENNLSMSNEVDLVKLFKAINQ